MVSYRKLFSRTQQTPQPFLMVHPQMTLLIFSENKEGKLTFLISISLVKLHRARCGFESRSWVVFYFYFLFIDFREKGREREKYQFAVPFIYAFIGWPACALLWDQTSKPGISGGHPNQLNYLVRDSFIYFLFAEPLFYLL